MASSAGAFRLGLVGAGRMGQTHLRALASAVDVSFIAVAEPVDSLRERAVATFGVTGYSSVADLLSDARVDGVVVVSPSDTHVEVVAAVAGARLPILCEKPCGVSPEDARRARDLVAEAGVALQVAYWRRFVPELQKLRERVLSGEFGEILSLSCLQWDGEPPASSFRARSGGIFIDMGVHEFDQARWLTSSDFATLSAVASSVVNVEADRDPDGAQVLASMTSGATALVSLGRHYAGGDMASVEVFGTRDHEWSMFLRPEDGERAQLEALRRQASAFAELARGGGAQGASVEDAIAALEVASSAAQRIAASGE